MRRKSLTLICVLLAAVTVSAHDFWLAGSKWHVSPGSTVTVTANVGQRFPAGDSYTRPERVEAMSLAGPDGSVSLPLSFFRRGSALAAGITLPTKPATYMIVMTIKPRFIEIDGPAFTKYAAAEGLTAVVEARAARGETAKPGRERYSRFAKLVLNAGGDEAGHVISLAGLPAEIVPDTDPSAARLGDTVGFRVLRNGQPVTGALVGAIDAAASKGGPDDWPLKARTDTDGRVRFSLPRKGPWLVRSVLMERRQGETGPQAVDWESFWVSIAFNTWSE
jgi:uncharacterized GH25 family protein